MNLQDVIMTKGTKKVESLEPHQRRLIMLTPNEIKPQINPAISPEAFSLYYFFPVLRVPALMKLIYDLNQSNSAQLIDINDAAKGLKFPPTHPAVNTIYVQHPCDPDRYYPAADFSRYLYEHKASEFINILGELKVHTAQFTFVKGVNTFAGVRMDIESKDSGRMTGELGASNVDAKGLTGILKASPTPGELNPDLSTCKWLEHEPTWQQMIASRTKHGLRELDVTFAHSGITSLSADLQAVIEEATIQSKNALISGSETIWNIHLNFADTKSQPSDHSGFIDKVLSYVSRNKKSA
jgi:hypothetical protein